MLAAALSLSPVVDAQWDDTTNALLQCTGPVLDCLGTYNAWNGQWTGGDTECQAVFIAFMLADIDYDEADDMAEDSGCCDNEKCTALCTSGISAWSLFRCDTLRIPLQKRHGTIVPDSCTFGSARRRLRCGKFARGYEGLSGAHRRNYHCYCGRSHRGRACHLPHHAAEEIFRHRQ